METQELSRGIFEAIKRVGPATAKKIIAGRPYKSVDELSKAGLTAKQIDAIKPLEQRKVAVSAPERELLLVEWLNALLSLSDIERMVFSKFDVTIEGASLTGTAWGEKLDRVRHEPTVEVKGATYHMLKVDKDNDGYVAQCVVDV